MVVVVSLGSNFDETRQPFGGHKLWNQIFIILQMPTQQKRGMTTRKSERRVHRFVLLLVKNYGVEEDKETGSDTMCPCRFSLIQVTVIHEGPAESQLD